jgi:hypothetical protein
MDNGLEMKLQTVRIYVLNVRSDFSKLRGTTHGDDTHRAADGSCLEKGGGIRFKRRQAL